MIWCCVPGCSGTATGVAPVTGTITNVTFYMESNGVAGFQAGDTLLGTGTLTGLNNYVYVTSTTNFSPGVYTYYAVATNSAGFSSNAAADTLTIYYSGPAGSGVSFGTYWWNSPGCGLYLSNFG